MIFICCFDREKGIVIYYLSVAKLLKRRWRKTIKAKNTEFKKETKTNLNIFGANPIAPALDLQKNIIFYFYNYSNL